MELIGGDTGFVIYRRVNITMVTFKSNQNTSDAQKLSTRTLRQG